MTLLFYDPLQYFERAGGTDFALRAGMTTDEVQAEREDVWKGIFASIKAREMARRRWGGMRWGSHRLRVRGGA